MLNRTEMQLQVTGSKYMLNQIKLLKKTKQFNVTRAKVLC